MGVDLKACVVTVFGQIQRAGYRFFVADVADELDVVGSVRCEIDGSVAVFAQGEEQALARFVELIGAPPRGRVTRVEVQESSVKPELVSFVVETRTIQEEIHDGCDRIIHQIREYRREFGEYRAEFRGLTGDMGKSSRVIYDKYDAVSESMIKRVDSFVVETAESDRRLHESQERLHQAVDNLVRAVDTLIETLKGQKSAQ